MIALKRNKARQAIFLNKSGEYAFDGLVKFVLVNNEIASDFSLLIFAFIMDYKVVRQA